MKKSSLLLLASSLLSASAYGVVALDFTNVSSVENYMVGNSATSGTDILRFNDVATGYDLLITTASNYTAANSASNGLIGSGVFGRINLNTNSTASFTFSIVDSGTTNLATVDSVNFSFLDIDSETPSAGPYESITVTQPSNLFRDVNTTLVLSEGGGQASLSNNTVGEIANPTSTTLTAAQSAVAATFAFENTNQFNFTFSTGANIYGGRNVFFGGSVTFDEIDGGTAVPEPSAYGLIIGIAALSFIATRRRKA